MPPIEIPLQAAVMTPRGRGAVAVIRVVGDHAVLDRDAPPLFRAANGRPLAAQPLERILFGQWGREAVEDVVVCRVDVETLEVHCHGGDRAVDRILQDWRNLGAEIVDWRKLVAATSDVLESELQDCLSRAITWRATEYLLHQTGGVLRGAFQELASLAWTRAERKQAAQSIENLLHWSDFGIHLSQPWRVVLTGKPNVGKSSLINALLGYQRSIVFDQPGTTRDVVTAETALDGWPVQLTDTAGIRAAAADLEAAGIARARQQLAEADLVVELIDVSEEQDERARDKRPEEEGSLSRRLLVAHKCDLPDRGGEAIPASAMRVSSMTGEGLDRLQHEIVRRLVPEPPPFTSPIPVTSRQVTLLRAMQQALSTDNETGYRSTTAAIFAGQVFL